MSKIAVLLKSTIVCFGTFLGGLIGGVDGLFVTLLVFIVCDYITGVLSAIVNNELNSYISFKGICKKLVYIILVIVANMLDTNAGFDTSLSIRAGVIYGLLFTEGISLLENAVKMGITVPDVLKNALKKLKPDSELDTEDKPNSKG